MACSAKQVEWTYQNRPEALEVLVCIGQIGGYGGSHGDRLMKGIYKLNLYGSYSMMRLFCEALNIGHPNVSHFPGWY